VSGEWGMVKRKLKEQRDGACIVSFSLKNDPIPLTTAGGKGLRYKKDAPFVKERLLI
jgi:hypothetical protein